MTKKYKLDLNKISKKIIAITISTLMFNMVIAPASANFTYINYLETGQGKYLTNKQKIDNFLQSRKDTETLSNTDNVLTKRIVYPKYETVDNRYRQVTAYNVGDVYQCDDTPCTAANGENICLALEQGYKRCAANFVSFGTVLDIESYGQCIVTDRMNSRYTSRVDIAMPYGENQAAREFGLRTLEVKILAKL